MKKNLLIASNNLADAKGIEGVFCNLEEVHLLPSVFSGRETIDTILAQDVDLLILDLFLHDLDGISVLDFIGKLNEDRRPLVFVTTALADDRLLQDLFYRLNPQDVRTRFFRNLSSMTRQRLSSFQLPIAMAASQTWPSCISPSPSMT